MFRERLLDFPATKVYGFVYLRSHSDGSGLITHNQSLNETVSYSTKFFVNVFENEQWIEVANASDDEREFYSK